MGRRGKVSPGNSTIIEIQFNSHPELSGSSEAPQSLGIWASQSLQDLQIISKELLLEQKEILPFLGVTQNCEIH